MNEPMRIIDWRTRADAYERRAPEWLVANGLGGYACGTITGLVTRRFDGLLIAAHPVPLGRLVMLTLFAEHVRLDDGRLVGLGAGQVTTEDEEVDHGTLCQFRLDLGLPVWRYDLNGIILERSLTLLHGQNTAICDWRLIEGAEMIDLELRPFLSFRGHDTRVTDGVARTYHLTAVGDRYEISADSALPTLHLLLRSEGATLTLDHGARQEVYYATEADRGYDCRGSVWSPGHFSVQLRRDHTISLTASTEPWSTITALRSGEAVTDERARRQALIAQADASLREEPASELILAADTFVIAPPRAEAMALDDIDAPPRTVIAGYHWFTDWGRDTMISLEGLTLLTGRHTEARGILQTFANHIRDGLIPNLFPEREGTGLYNTADATLWFFHALDRYVELTGDRDTLAELLPRLIDIVHHHQRGTHFGIGVDHHDGLLRQGADGYQLTWMDAKVGDWVVTPRRGKAVEINALWYNALRTLAVWVEEFQYRNTDIPNLTEMADFARSSFNQRFWYADGGYLFDVIDGENGDDSSCRPNQVFAIALRFPILDENRWEAVMTVVEQRLLTPVGLRSLSADHPDYKPKYHGDLRSRDAAYHQGTVWAWLIGPFIDAWMKVHPGRRDEARRFLDGFKSHLDEACVGSISEVFDAEPPFTPRGCIAQAWSVAEFLRAWRNTAT
ncbi:MAG: glycogen debranching enzyme family protein [Rhodospirillales bacterium]|nr:glycogen debranching enzyme family protein [Rhodospirillales bacterium]